MAGYADYRRLLMQGYTPEEIAAYFQTKGAAGKVDKGPPESTFRKAGQQYNKTRGLGGQKQIYERLPGARDAELVNLSQRNMAWDDPGGPGEFTAMQPQPEPAMAIQEAPVPNAGPFQARPPAQTSADQKLMQAAATLPGPKVNWQNGPSQAFYEQSAGWNTPERGMGTRPMSHQFPAATSSVMAQGMPQLDQQRKMVSEGLLADPQNQDAQRVNIMQQANFDLLGQQQAQSMFNPMSFLGKIFGGMF